MSGNTIKVYARVRPTRKPSGFFVLKPDIGQIEFDVPVDHQHDMVNNSRSSYKFRFDGLIDMPATQEDVFNTIAKDAIDNALAGYNSTIFAYGQTGSGKTFTITGGAERYRDRGIIPRTLSYMFDQFNKQTDTQYSVYISYLELYNENGYDLLDPSHETKSIEELPRVTLMEDDEGGVHLRNLSMHLTTSEEDALNKLFLGDTNRAISATAMNEASSRSHCIFTLSIESRKEGSSKVRRSKLHMVDLAGSERVHKTGATGQVLREAKHINTSLHFLEMVIVALHERSKRATSHVPYRNSMLTSVLRDSLGGNCKTVMIATVNAEEAQTGETISTCRFAQRVASVKNHAIINEQTDPYEIIKELKAQVTQLKSEIALLQGNMQEGAELDDADKAELRRLVDGWHRAGEDKPLNIGQITMDRLQFAFHRLRELGPSDAAASRRGDGGGGSPEDEDSDHGRGGGSDPPSVSDHALREELKRMQGQIQQRDNEIAILVNMVQQASTRPALPPAARPPPASPPVGMPVPHQQPPQSYQPPAPAQRQSYAPAGPIPQQEAGSAVGAMLADQQLPVDQLEDQGTAFAHFKRAYPKRAMIQDNKRLLREQYDQARGLAERVNRSRQQIAQLKSQIEQVRVESAVASVGQGGGGAAGPTELENELRGRMDECKQNYKQDFDHLRALKKEIERIQRFLEKGHRQLLSDFESWYGIQRRRAGLPAVATALPITSGAELRSSSATPPAHAPAPVPAAAHPQQQYVATRAAATTTTTPLLPLTGNPDADADIQAFFQAKEQLKQRMSASRPGT